MSEGAAIGFAGLSHLGIVYSMAAAVKGYSIVAFDERPGLAAELSAGRLPIVEPGLAEAFGQYGHQIRYTGDATALAACPLIFITLDVPTDELNESNLGPLRSLIDRVRANAGSGAVLVLMSQVPPGFCRKLGGSPDGLQLFYQVETLIFGNAMERALRPERYMVGCMDAADLLPAIYRSYLDAFQCPVLPMRYESAELCKIAINCFLVSAVSTSNTLAEICERVGADWYEIAPALRLDKRIGPHAYLNPGLGIAGGNLERDLVTVQKLAAEHGTDARLVTAWQDKSTYDRDWVLRKLFHLGLLTSPAGAPLALWGLAYKAETDSTKNSPARALVEALPHHAFRAYDPVAKLPPNAPGVQVCSSAMEAVQGAAALIVMTPWKEFSSITVDEIKARMVGRRVIDPYSVLHGPAFRKSGFEYHCLGA